MITLSKLKDKLEQKQYTVALREYDDVTYLQCFLPTENNNHRILAFGIKLDNDNIILWDASLQVSKEIEFQNEKDLFDFIDDNFSLK